MQVFKKNTEGHLFQTLKDNWERNPANRCLLLRFSQTMAQAGDEVWFEQFLDVLKKKIDVSGTDVFLCADRDVFIIDRHLTRKNTFILLDGLSSLMPQLAPASFKGLASLFEIGVDWAQLRIMCEKKIENIAIENQRRRMIQDQKPGKAVTIEKILETIDQNMIFNLRRRRSEREVIEIMVVEDDPFSQKLVSNALSKNYSVHLTNDGQGALYNYVNKAPDVLFLDIGLPDINGHEVLKKIFEIDPEAYVIMFSGNGDRVNVLKAVETGAKGFVGKPFTEEKLNHYIDRSPYVQAKLKKADSYEFSA